MLLNLKVLKSVAAKAILTATAVAGFFAFAGAPSAEARDWNDGRAVVRYDDYRLHRAEERRGFYSPAANHWRYERREALAHGWRDRFGCWHRY
jgi:hypothetical protein